MEKKFECEMTIRADKIVYDLNRIANPVVVVNKKLWQKSIFL